MSLNISYPLEQNTLKPRENSATKNYNNQCFLGKFIKNTAKNQAKMVQFQPLKSKSKKKKFTAQDNM